MRSSRLFQVSSRLALAGLLLGSTLGISAAPQAAVAGSGRDDDPAWIARVTGTQGRGLLVRSGPGRTFAIQTTLPENTRVQVIDGPEADAEGHTWYLVTGYDRVNSSGWSAGEFLRPIDPAEPDPPAVAGVQAAGTGRTFQARISAYSYQTATGGAHGSITRTGTPVRWGTVAVDPRVIPLGTRLLIEGFDTVFVAEDTGGAVRGSHIDVFFPDYAAAVRFGIQYRNVTLLS